MLWGKIKQGNSLSTAGALQEGAIRGARGAEVLPALGNKV